MKKSSLLFPGLLGVALTLGTLPKLQAAPTSGGSACTLVTAGELARIKGDTLKSKQYLYSYPDGKGSTCTYGADQIQLVLFTGTGSEKRYNDYIEGEFAKVPKHITIDRTKKPVSGVGSSAWYLHPNGVTSILVVRKGLNTFAVSMVKHKDTVETIDAKLLSIAKIATSRIGLL